MHPQLLLPLILFPRSTAILCYVGTLADHRVTEGNTFCGSAYNLDTDETRLKGLNTLTYFIQETLHLKEHQCAFLKDGSWFINCICEEDKCNRPHYPREVAKQGFGMPYF